ncbi:response regulator [bacterium]|nr:response regulator [bacterium]
MTKAKILIADDDADLVEIIAMRLANNNYGILKAYQGIQAVEVAQKEKPNLILLDWQMPYGKGSAVLEMLRENEETMDIPVIILSGVSESGMEEVMKSYKVKYFIRKPYNDKELLNLIEQSLA